MHKLLHTALVLTMPFALSGTILLCWAGEELPVWYEFARKFVEANARLVDEANTPGNNALELLNAQEAAVKKLKELPSPSVKDLNQMIQSARIEEREAALATAMILGRIDSSLVKATVMNYEREQGFLAKFYSQRVLANITPSQMKEVEGQLVKILQRETDESIIIAGLQTVVRLEREKRTELFVHYMTNGSEGLQRACAVYLGKIGNPDIDVVTSALKKRNAASALGYLDRVRAEELAQ